MSSATLTPLLTVSMEPNMSEISRAVLFGKLDTLLFTSLESATAFCKLRGNPYVELVHWLRQLMPSAGRRSATHYPPFRS